MKRVMAGAIICATLVALFMVEHQDALAAALTQYVQSKGRLAADPAGACSNGAHYYNTTSNTERCCKSAAWSLCGISAVTSVGADDIAVGTGSGLTGFPYFQVGIEKGWTGGDGINLDFVGLQHANTLAASNFVVLQADGQSGLVFGSDMNGVSGPHHGGNSRQRGQLLWDPTSQKTIIRSGRFDNFRGDTNGDGGGIDLVPAHGEFVRLTSGFSNPAHVDVGEDGNGVGIMLLNSGIHGLVIQSANIFQTAVVGGGGSVAVTIRNGAHCICQAEVTADLTGCTADGAVTLTITGTAGAKVTYLCPALS